jgi:hypothetical protein
MNQPMDDLKLEPVAWMSPGKERLEFSRKDTVYGSHTLPLYTADQMREYAKQAVEAERGRCVGIIEAHRIPVGNSAAGEMACEWTYDALLEIRDKINVTPPLDIVSDGGMDPRNAFDAPKIGCVQHDCDECKARLAQPAPVQYQRREIGEGDWMDCTKEEYKKAMALPEMDTRVITSPQPPAQRKPPTASQGARHERRSNEAAPRLR